MITQPKRRRTRLLSLAVVGIVGAALALSGCSGATTPKASGNGSLLLAADNGSPNFERNFNPYSGSKRTLVSVIYEPLFVMNTLDGKMTPFLATDYKQPDAKTIDATIRSGVKWSDGKDFTPEDVVFTYDLLKKYTALDSTGVWQYIDTIDVDGDTVVFHLKDADVPAAGIVLAVPIVPKHIWSGIADPVTDTNADPVGTGPYVLDKFTPTQYTLAKNKTYWQADKVAAPELVIPASNSNLELMKQPYGWAYAFIDDVKGTWVKARKGNTYWFPPGGTVALMPNLTKAPFDDVDFRQGLSHALDRSKVADIAETGYVEAASQAGLLLPNQKDWLDPSLPDSGNVTQDLSAAAADFEKAGYSMKDGKLVDASGKQLTVTITTPNGWTDWLRGAQEVQKQLQAAGLSVKLDQPQPAAYFQAEQNGDFELIMGSFGGTGSVYTDFNNLLNSSFFQPVGTSTQANFQRFKDPAVDAVLTQLRQAVDVDQQKQLSHKLQQVMFEDVPVLSLFYGGLWGLFSNGQYTGWPSADDPYASPATWGLNPLLVLTHIRAAS